MSPLPSVTFRSELDPIVRKELDQFDGELTGYLLQEHDDDGHHTDITADSVTIDGPLAIIGGPVTIDGVPVGSTPSPSTFFYRADVNFQTASDPGSGRMRWNAVSQHAATALYLDRLTDDNFDAMLFFELSNISDTFVIQDATLSANYQVWTMTGPAVDHVDWFEVPVAFSSFSGAGVFGQLDRVAVLVKSTGGGGGGGVHAYTHTSGGSDPVTVTTLAGYPGGTTNFLRADGTFAAPPTGGGVAAHATTHSAGNTDPVTVTALAGYPGGTATFLRADGSFAAPTGVTPAAHATTHQPGGADAMAVDAAAATGSLRTLGTGAQQATAGNDARLTNARTPTTHATTHSAGNSDPVTVTALAGYPGGSTNFLRADGTFAAPTGVTPAAHATTHKSAGSDPIKLDELAAPTDITTLNASTGAHGLLPKLPGTTTTFLRGDGTFTAPTATPSAHATTHKSGGSDPIKLDEFAAPTDITTLNASTGAHGLLKKLSNVATQYLDGQGNWTVPATGTPGAHHTTHETGGADAIVALSGAVITTGTVADARLSTQVALKNASPGNVFTGTLTERGRSVPMGEWQDYTATWAAQTTAPAIGNGTIAARYTISGKTVTFRIAVTMGSTTTYGVAGWGFGLPFAPFGEIHGSAWVYNGVAGTVHTGTVMAGGFLSGPLANMASIIVHNYYNTPNGLLMASDMPFVWASNVPSYLFLQGTYEIA